jgi:hypothetical protein
VNRPLAGQVTACAVVALGTLAIAKCGGSNAAGAPGGTSPRADTPSVRGVSPQPRAAAQGPASGLAPPGTRLGFGQSATVAWVPQPPAAGKSPTALDLRVSVESIEKGSIADFANMGLDASERASTPYYVKMRITALGDTPPPPDSDPAITLQAIDDRGQEQQSVTIIGTFSRCDDATPPKPFVSQKSYQSCLAYLMPGGGSIQKVRWDDGPAAAGQVTPYFEDPIVWAGG